MLIVLSGLPATGKSRLAEALARALSLPVFSVDPIEWALLRAGITPSFETGLAAYLVAESLSDACLARGQGAIVDAVNAEEAGKEMWRGLAKRHGVALRVLECVCSDEELHRARLEARTRPCPAEFREPTWSDVVRRREAYTPWELPVARLDAVHSLEANLANALGWLADAPSASPPHGH